MHFQGSISNPGDGEAIATAIVNTALGTSAAGICTLIFNKTGIVPGTGGNYSFLITMNGSLTGNMNDMLADKPSPFRKQTHSLYSSKPCDSIQGLEDQDYCTMIMIGKTSIIRVNLN